MVAPSSPEVGPSLVVHEPKTNVDLSKSLESHRFAFDAVFNEADSNAVLYAATLRPLLDHVFSGGTATVFAFGQTGSGKTLVSLLPIVIGAAVLNNFDDLKSLLRRAPIEQYVVNIATDKGIAG